MTTLWKGRRPQQKKKKKLVENVMKRSIPSPLELESHMVLTWFSHGSVLSFLTTALTSQSIHQSRELEPRGEANFGVQ